MHLTRLSDQLLRRLPPRLAESIYVKAGRLPKVRSLLDAEYDRILEQAPIGETGEDQPSYRHIPVEPLDRAAIIDALAGPAKAERDTWSAGRASGAVYHGGDEHLELLSKAYTLHSQSNPLHVDIWPSAVKMESEVVSMAAAMLGADQTDDEVVGTVTSGGTESIILAMKAYRDRAKTRRPEMVLPDSAHVAFDKAAHYLGIRPIRIPVGSDYRADVDAMAQAIGRRTIVVVGSAPGFPHGIVDPIPELSAMTRQRGTGFHTDACLGGFILPWAERLGNAIPRFDFRLPGVTSMSVDTHKYGYGAKGTSVVLYRGRDLRRHQYFVATNWSGGLYYSPTMSGSRPGALIATAWAAMLSMGEEGYLQATEAILEAGTRVKAGIAGIPELMVLGDPLWVIAFTSDTVNIYEVMARMTQKGWSLNGLHRPPAVHIALTLRHTEPGVIDAFLADLRAAVAETRAAGHDEQTGAAPVYGMAATFPARGAVGELLRRYIDKLYEVRGS
jgi:glutamate/tyrosine decarboxylase-like PLP-dependent enzyme